LIPPKKRLPTLLSFTKSTSSSQTSKEEGIQAIE
jgi:hypothetical protein